MNVQLSWIDILILSGTLLFIAIYGIWKTRKNNNLEGYLAGNRNTPWWAIGLSIMATQASAITFLSTPGMGFESGLKFAQFYFGLPIAMIIVATVFVPLFNKLKVYTAYEFLENRFNLNVRLLTAFLFLVQRGLAAGITIYAPSIILSVILGWPLNLNILVIGTLVILYTVSGGTRAVTQTHKQQMVVIFVGLIIAGGILLSYLTEELNWGTLWDLAQAQEKTKLFVTEFNWNDKYNIWSGLIGGTFLMLSYFGTDQSQVQRYLSGKNLKEIKTGLYFNGIVKIPMQIFILALGILVFLFYQLKTPPVHFDPNVAAYYEEHNPEQWKEFNQQHEVLSSNIQSAISAYDLNPSSDGMSQIKKLQGERQELSAAVVSQTGELFQKKVESSDYVFIYFVLNNLPIGLIGLLLAVIFSAAMSSTSAELNALATTTVIDFRKRLSKQNLAPEMEVKSAKFFTLLWGVLAIIFALIAKQFENLVEYVNVLGSLFYGTILGVFVVAFFLKRIQGVAVFWAAIISEMVIIWSYFEKAQVEQFFGTEISFLWNNLIGCMLVVIIAGVIQIFTTKENSDQPVV